ncbi:MAG: hypothetical protein CMH08_02770 [Marinovum sp.]|nr:hypothetical protein [Marinovum sp.]|tara:strand:+ start:438 stop:1031 length:594 start_codon:yes stop_codon:yes gene_type:complete
MVRSKMMTVLALVLASGLLAACKTGTATPPPQIFTTDAYQPLNLNARRLEIIDNWQMPVVDPYIGYWVSPLPSSILADWASHVLRPAGGSGEIIFDMKRVAVTMTDLPAKVGIDGLLTDRQSRKVTAEIKAKVMWLQPVGGTQALADLSAAHSITIRESATANEVSRIVNDAMKGALVRLDSQIRKELTTIDRIILP